MTCAAFDAGRPRGRTGARKALIQGAIRPICRSSGFDAVLPADRLEVFANGEDQCGNVHQWSGQVIDLKEVFFLQSFASAPMAPIAKTRLQDLLHI
jgi:hypothetical protein